MVGGGRVPPRLPAVKPADTMSKMWQCYINNPAGHSHTWDRWWQRVGGSLLCLDKATCLFGVVWNFVVALWLLSAALWPNSWQGATCLSNLRGYGATGVFMCVALGHMKCAHTSSDSYCYWRQQSREDTVSLLAGKNSTLQFAICTSVSISHTVPTQVMNLITYLEHTTVWDSSGQWSTFPVQGYHAVVATRESCIHKHIHCAFESISCYW